MGLRRSFGSGGCLGNGDIVRANNLESAVSLTCFYYENTCAEVREQSIFSIPYSDQTRPNAQVIPSHFLPSTNNCEVIV